MFLFILYCTVLYFSLFCIKLIISKNLYFSPFLFLAGVTDKTQQKLY